MAMETQIMVRLPAAVLGRVDRLAGPRGRGEWVRVAIEMRLAEIDEPDAEDDPRAETVETIRTPAQRALDIPEVIETAPVPAASAQAHSERLAAEQAARDARKEAWFARQKH
jgi:hypothetical protein